jgi:hypothetical protein
MWIASQQSVLSKQMNGMANEVCKIVKNEHEKHGYISIFDIFST